MRVSRGGDVVGTLRTERSFFPSADPTLGPVSRFFEGEATSEVGLRAGLRRDVWSAISPDVARPAQAGRGGRPGVHRRQGRCRPQQREIALAQALDGLTRSYAANPPPATFRLIVSPLVSWIWIGALIVFLRRPDRPLAAARAAPRGRSPPATRLAWRASSAAR